MHVGGIRILGGGIQMGFEAFGCLLQQKRGEYLNAFLGIRIPFLSIRIPLEESGYLLRSGIYRKV